MDQLTPTNQPLLTVEQVANQVAASYAFSDYQSCKAQNTLRRQKADLALFAAYLAEVGPPRELLDSDPAEWAGVTWGLVEGFNRWQLNQGYSVGSINVRLATVKAYAKLAVKAGSLDHSEYALIRMVSGYSHKEASRIDDQRRAADLDTRRGAKKAEPKSISREQANQLKNQPDTPQGRRDSLIMCLFLDHGLRVGEVAGLAVTDIDLGTNELRFYRPKVNKLQTHRLTVDTHKVAIAYLASDAPVMGPLLRSSRKDGRLHDPGMTERAITDRVKVLGLALGIEGLSAHDLRHYWATQAARNGTALDRLQDAGGWSSPAMPLRYIEAYKIANEGVKLGD